MLDAIEGWAIMAVVWDEDTDGDGDDVAVPNRQDEDGEGMTAA